MRTVFTAAMLFVFATNQALSQVPQRISDVLQPFVDDHLIAGAVVLTATKDQVLDVSTVGFADIAAKKSMSPDALFWIASMSKPITATAFMMLVDEGKVSLDDPVEKYLPEFIGQMVTVEKDDDHVLLKKPAHPITIRNILSHTSGLPFKSAIEEPTLDMIPLATAVKSHAMQPLLFEPDTKYQYANAGINTAARIMEVVTGQEYAAFMKARLFDPLAMLDTTFYPTEDQVKRIALSYKATADKSNIEATPVTQLQYPLTDPARQPMPAGGLFSTATDIARFCQMILNGGTMDGRRYITEKSIREMTRRQTAEGLASYGLGWAVSPSGFGHGGAYSTDMFIDPSAGLITIFMVQNAGWRDPKGKEILPTFKKAAALLQR
ncbi:MAG: beta-lactamase family protein [Verrucomicrobiales bacterium]|nr:beta-lactamase family protein [Verrucomicrobiales bacterium]MCP5560296.1 beta-lactamase family protein [Verrucomicrobiaceae bacterium]